MIDHSMMLPEVETWPHRPLFLQRGNTTVVIGNGALDDPCPIGIPFDFESELFKGRALIRFRNLGLKSDSPAKDNEYFEGRKRLSQIVIQGQFKKEMKVSGVVTGTEFVRPFKMYVLSFVNRIVCGILHRVCPSVELDLASKTPKVLSNLAGSMQVIRADHFGSQPDISANDEITENNALLFGTAEPIKNRKKIFSDPTKASKYNVDTNTVCTFNHFDDTFDYVGCTMDLKMMRFDLASTLDGQPFQMMAKHKSGSKEL
jgi:hypothetical protein